MNLSEFIDIEMKKRGLGVREFAKMVGVSHSVISKHLNEQGVVPSIEFLIKLSDATGISLRTVLGVAFPEIAERLAIDPAAEFTAQAISNLPEQKQAILLDFIRGSK